MSLKSRSLFSTKSKSATAAAALATSTETMATSSQAKILPNEAYIRKCLESQTLDYMLRKSGCFNLLVVGEDGLGKVTFLETLFGLPANALRETRAKVLNSMENLSRDGPMQIVTEKIMLSKQQLQQEASSIGSGSSVSEQVRNSIRSTGQLTVRLMTTVNYSISESCRQPWNLVADYIGKQVTQYVNSRATNPLSYTADDDQRVHCCVYFLPPMGARGLRRCDLLALKALDDRVNIIPVLAKADCYTAAELQQKKEAVAADVDRNNLSVHQYLDCKEAWTSQPLAVIGATYPDFSRTLPWGTVSVDDERCSDVGVLRTLIIEQNMLMLRKTTKRLHISAIKPLAGTLQRK